MGVLLVTLQMREAGIGKVLKTRYVWPGWETSTQKNERIVELPKIF